MRGWVSLGGTIVLLGWICVLGFIMLKRENLGQRVVGYDERRTGGYGGWVEKMA